MSHARPAHTVGRLLAALALLMALISPVGQRLLTAVATRVGQLYTSTVTAVVDHQSPAPTHLVAPANPGRNPR